MKRKHSLRIKEEMPKKIINLAIRRTTKKPLTTQYYEQQKRITTHCVKRALDHFNITDFKQRRAIHRAYQEYIYMLNNWEEYSEKFKIRVKLNKLNIEGQNKTKEFDFLKTANGQTITPDFILLSKLKPILGNSKTAQIFSEHNLLLEISNFKDPKYLNELNQTVKTWQTQNH